MNEVVNALKPEQQQMANGGDAPLRVVNGVRTFRSLWLRRWMYTSPPLKTFMVVPETSPLDAVAISPPTPSKSLKRNPALGLPSLRSPSLATLERACQKIFRKPPLHSLRQSLSQEQRRLAMERDMLGMVFPEARDEDARSRWRQKET